MGWTYGLANEAALKLREAAGMWTESYPAMEYRHGPMAATGPHSVVWLFEIPSPGQADRRHQGGGRHHLGAATRTRWPPWSWPSWSPSRPGKRRGLDPDRPRNLTRSVILTSAADLGGMN